MLESRFCREHFDSYVCGGDGFLTVPKHVKGFDSSVCEECLKHYFSAHALQRKVTICARVQVAVGVNVVPVVPLVMPC